jgi:hypothetical protein
MCIIRICDDKKISFVQIMVQWLRIYSLNVEVRRGQGFKPSHLH